MAEENKNTPQEILKLPIVLFALMVALIIYIIWTMLVPAVQGYTQAKDSYKTALETLSQKEQELEALKASNAPVANNNSPTGISKEFFKPLESGSDSESVIASEFNEILSLMTSNAIKTRSVKYDYTPDDDAFYKNASDRYSVCKLDMSMIATYSNFKNFIKELYKHEHYLDIARVEIVPYQKNKTILLIDLQLRLYAEKI